MNPFETEEDDHNNDIRGREKMQVSNMNIERTNDLNLKHQRNHNKSEKENNGEQRNLNTNQIDYTMEDSSQSSTCPEPNSRNNSQIYQEQINEQKKQVTKKESENPSNSYGKINEHETNRMEIDDTNRTMNKSEEEAKKTKDEIASAIGTIQSMHPESKAVLAISEDWSERRTCLESLATEFADQESDNESYWNEEQSTSKKEKSNASYFVATCKLIEKGMSDKTIPVVMASFGTFQAILATVEKHLKDRKRETLHDDSDNDYTRALNQILPLLIKRVAAKDSKRMQQKAQNCLLTLARLDSLKGLSVIISFLDKDSLPLHARLLSTSVLVSKIGISKRNDSSPMKYHTLMSIASPGLSDNDDKTRKLAIDILGECCKVCGKDRIMKNLKGVKSATAKLLEMKITECTSQKKDVSTAKLSSSDMMNKNKENNGTSSSFRPFKTIQRKGNSNQRPSTVQGVPSLTITKVTEFIDCDGTITSTLDQKPHSAPGRFSAQKKKHKSERFHNSDLQKKHKMDLEVVDLSDEEEEEECPRKSLLAKKKCFMHQSNQINKETERERIQRQLREELRNAKYGEYGSGGNALSNMGNSLNREGYNNYGKHSARNSYVNKGKSTVSVNKGDMKVTDLENLL